MLDAQAEAFEHLGEDRIAAEDEMLDVQFDRHVAVPQMIRSANEVRGVSCRHAQHRLRFRDDARLATVGRANDVVFAQHRPARQTERNVPFVDDAARAAAFLRGQSELLVDLVRRARSGDFDGDGQNRKYR